MKIKQMAECLNSVSVRQKAKRILALTLAVLMVNPVTGYGATAHAQEAETITAFAKLSGEIATQQIVVGDKETDINLPDTLDVTISAYGANTTESIVKDSKAKEIPIEEAKPDESTPEEPAADENSVEEPVSDETSFVKSMFSEKNTLELQTDEPSAEDSNVAENDVEESQEDASAEEDNTVTDSEATMVLYSSEVPLVASTTGSAISADSDDADTEQTEETITTEERTLAGITWEINAERSGSDIFNSESAGAIFFYEPVLPEGYTLADGVSLPQIQVKIEENVQWAFNQSITIDGVEITVKAEKGVFPEGAVLYAERVIKAEDKEKIQSAVSESVQSVDTAKTVTKLVSFDITITDVDGNEFQPDTSKGEVKVSFAQMPMVTEDTVPTQELKVFHMNDTQSDAKALDTTVNQESGTLEAAAEHFSLYTVALLTATAEDGEASVTNAEGAITYHATVEEAVVAALGMDGATVTLLKDPAVYVSIVDMKGEFTLDLNGKTWSGLGLDVGIASGSLKVHVKDSVGSGKMGTLACGMRSSATLAGGSYDKLDFSKFTHTTVTLDSILEDGYVYKNTDGTIHQVTEDENSDKIIKNVSVKRQVSATLYDGTVVYCRSIDEALTKPNLVTIKLLDDIVRDDYVAATTEARTIDLNGKRWTCRTAGTALILRDCRNITITDSSAEAIGRISSTGGEAVISITGSNTENIVIEKGRYSNTGGMAIKLDADNSRMQLRINGGTFINETGGSVAILNGGTCHIFGGTFSGELSANTSVRLSGGSFSKIRLSSNYGSPLNHILGSERCYKANDGQKLTGEGTTYLENVEVIQAPITITGQNNPNTQEQIATVPLSVNVKKAATAVGEITYQWYQRHNGSEYTKIAGATTAQYFLQGSFLPGSYNFHCVVACDGLELTARESSNLVIEKITPTISLKLFEKDGTEIPNGGKCTTDAYFKVWLKYPDGTPAEVNGIRLSRLGQESNDSKPATWDGTEGCYITGALGDLYAGEVTLRAGFRDFSHETFNAVWSEEFTFTATKVKKDQNPLSTEWEMSTYNNTTKYGTGNGKLAWLQLDGGPSGFHGMYFYVQKDNGVLTGYENPNYEGVYTSPFNVIGAGTVTVTAVRVGDADYNDATVSKEITIAKGDAPSITYPTASNIAYGQKLSDSSLTGGSTQYGTFAWTNGDIIPTVSNSGYEVTFTPNADTIKNYEATNTTSTVAITVSKGEQAEFTIIGVANDITYGDAPFFISTSGGTSDGSVAYTVTEGDAISVDSSTGEVTVNKAGTATITATKTCGNYLDKTSTVEITVNPAIPVLNWKESAQELSYTGSQAVIAAPLAKGINDEIPSGRLYYSYKKADETTFLSGLPTDAGNYLVKAYIASEGNYAQAESMSLLSLSILKATPTLEITDIDYTGKVYDGKAVEKPIANQMTITGASYEDVQFRYAKTDDMSDATTEAPANAGSYFVQAFIPDSDNTSAASSTPKSYEITKARLGYNVAFEFFAASNTARDYTLDLRRELPTPPYPQKYGEIRYTVKQINVAGAFATSPTDNDVTADGKLLLKLKAFNTTDSRRIVTLTIDSDNFEIGDLWIYAAYGVRTPLEIGSITTPNHEFDGNSYTYTGTPAFTDNGAAVENVSYSIKYESNSMDTVYPLSEIAPSNAGNYKLILEVNGESANTYIGRLILPFEITKREVVITAKDREILTGEPIPTIATPVLDHDYTVTGLIGGDSLDGEISMGYTSVPDNTVAGTYPITISGGAVGGNYALTYVQGTLTVKNDPDIATVTTAKNNAEGASYANTTQASHGDEEAVSNYVTGIAAAAVNNTDVTITVNKVSYTSPIAGTAADPDGTNGSFSFTVTVQKGAQSQTTAQKRITLTATAFNGISHAQAVAAAKEAVVDGTVNVAFGADQTAITAAVQGYVNGKLTGNVVGVTATVTYTSGNSYKVDFSKGSVTDSKTITMTVNESADPDSEIVTAAKTAAENANYAVTTQAATANEVAANTYVQNIATKAIHNTDVTVTVNKVTYTPPMAGTSADPDGTNGSYIFTVTVRKGAKSQITAQKNLTITATAYTGGSTGGSGSSSGGSSSGGGSSTVITPPADKPNSPTQGEIRVDAKVDESSNVAVNITDKTINDAYNKAFADAKKDGSETHGITLVLNVKTGSKTANRLTVNLPRTVQDTIISKKIVNTVVVVDNPDIKINMDLSTVKEINKQAQSDVNITVAKQDNSKLTGSAKTAIGKRPVFDLKINYGSGKQVTNFGAGSVAVEIPYTLGANEEAGNVQAVYVDTNGKVQWLTSSVYNRVNKVLSFSTNHFSTYGVGYKTTNTAFTDIANHWAKENIEFVVSRGLFSGTSNTTFSPNTAMTRGMFVTALGRLAEADVSKYTKSSFSDVTADAYYMGYVEWATKNGIVKGISDGKFAPDQSITREQMAVIMVNYAKKISFTLPKIHAETAFADNAKISTYAKDAVKAMQMAGVISGKDGNKFDPQGTATRAEVSAVFKRFVEQ